MPILIGGFIFSRPFLIEFLKHIYHLNGCQHGLCAMVTRFSKRAKQSHQVHLQ